MKTLTLGNGFIADHLPYDKIIDRIDLTNITSIIDKYKPDVLVNCIGKTGRPNIDWCENNKEITAWTNTILPIAIAEECSKRSIHLIHIGTGCIFFGYRENIYSWEEDDFATPQSYYAKTKYAADLAIGDMKNVTILRINLPISSKNHPRNLINKLANYKTIIPTNNSITFMEDFVRCVEFVKQTHIGIYHMTSKDTINNMRIMQIYKTYVSDHFYTNSHSYEPDCCINVSKLLNLGFTMDSSEKMLEKTMKEYFKNYLMFI